MGYVGNLWQIRPVCLGKERNPSRATCFTGWELRKESPAVLFWKISRSTA